MFIVFVAIFWIGYKSVPVLYKGFVTVPGVCQEGVDMYKTYGREFVLRDVGERLDTLGIPKDKRSVRLEREESRVYLTIYYSDVIDLYGKYRRVFYFDKTCESAVSSLF